MGVILLQESWIISPLISLGNLENRIFAMCRAPEDQSSEKVHPKKLSNSAKRETVLDTNAVRVAKCFSFLMMYVLKNIIFIKVLILQDSEGHVIVFVEDALMVNKQ